MKTYGKLTLSIVLLLCVTLLMAGCGKKGLDISGKWDNSDLMDDSLFSSSAGLGIEAPKEQWIEFTKDGVMAFMADGKTLQEYLKAGAEKQDNSAEAKALFQTMIDAIPVFTYKIDGDKVVLSMGGESHTMDAKLEGDKLTLTSPDGSSTTFTRHQ